MEMFRMILKMVTSKGFPNFRECTVTLLREKKTTSYTNVLMNGVVVQALQIFSSHRQDERGEIDLQSLDLTAAAPDTRPDVPAASCTLYIICAALQKPVATT